MNLSWQVTGYRKITVPSGQVTRLMNLCMRMGIDPAGYEAGQGEATFFCRPRTALRLARAAASAGVDVTVGKIKGLPARAARLCKRPGLVCGAILSVLLYVLSCRAVWCVEVTGNERLTAADVTAELEAAGFGVGTPVAGLDMRRLENEILHASRDIAWISIHVSGQVAEVQIRETLPTEIPPRDDAPANLVASADGQIERLEILEGTPVVKIGQAVLKGELLVSGVADSEVVGIRFSRADGAVLARVNREIVVDVPFVYTEKTPDAPVCIAKEIIFYKKYINFFKSTGNCPPDCDTIERIRTVRLPGGHSLPLGIRTTLRVGFTENEITRTPDEALEAAFAELAGRIGELDGELIRKNTVTGIGDEGIRLICRVTVIENIAVPLPIDVGG